MHFVYILRNEKGKHYIGENDNLDRRLAEHNSTNSHFTGNNGPWILAASVICKDRVEGRALERKLKSFKNPSYAIEHLRKLKTAGA